MSIENYLISRYIRTTIRVDSTAGALTIDLGRNNNRVYLGAFMSDILEEGRLLTIVDTTATPQTVCNLFDMITKFELYMPMHGDWPTKQFRFRNLLGVGNIAIVQGTVPEGVLQASPRELATWKV